VACHRFVIADARNPEDRCYKAVAGHRTPKGLLYIDWHYV
jgi:hypothetical protein